MQISNLFHVMNSTDITNRKRKKETEGEQVIVGICFLELTLESGPDNCACSAKLRNPT